MTAGTGSHEVVLVGGGHTHVQVMRALAREPEPGLSLTLVTERRLTPYSGMLPGHIAGHYSHAQMHIDLHRLAEATGTRLVEAQACGLDRADKMVLTGCGQAIPYDTLSLNLGITPDLSGIRGAEDFALAVKPISTFLERLDSLLVAASCPQGPRRFAIIGGGAAGVELAFALRARLGSVTGGAASVHIAILASRGVLLSLNPCMQRRTRRALAEQGIEVHDNFRAIDIKPGSVLARDGRRILTDAVLVSTAARAPGWLANTDLPLAEDGSIQTTRTLASLCDANVFAVGDCATIVQDPRPKAGVFAVRQGPALVRNLRQRVRGRPPLPYHAQHAFLSILIAGDRRAIAGWGRWLCLDGPLIWYWKDWIDRRFMRLFSP